MQIRTHTKRSIRFATAFAACFVVGWSLAFVLPRQYASLLMTLSLALACPLILLGRKSQRIVTVTTAISTDERNRFIARNTFWLFVFLAGLGFSSWCALFAPPFTSRPFVGLGSVMVAAVGLCMMWKTTMDHVAKLTAAETDAPRKTYRP